MLFFQKYFRYFKSLKKCSKVKAITITSWWSWSWCFFFHRERTCLCSQFPLLNFFQVHLLEQEHPGQWTVAQTTPTAGQTHSASMKRMVLFLSTILRARLRVPTSITWLIALCHSLCTPAPWRLRRTTSSGQVGVQWSPPPPLPPTSPVKMINALVPM